METGMELKLQKVQYEDHEEGLQIAESQNQYISEWMLEWENVH